MMNTDYMWKPFFLSLVFGSLRRVIRGWECACRCTRGRTWKHRGRKVSRKRRGSYMYICIYIYIHTKTHRHYTYEQDRYRYRYRHRYRYRYRYTANSSECLQAEPILFGTSSTRVFASRAKPKVLADFRGSRAEASQKHRGSPNSQTCTLAHFCSKLPATKQLPACVPKETNLAKIFWFVRFIWLVVKLLIWTCLRLKQTCPLP